ncbi:MAG: ThuA domain-containing protein [Phycisphaerales bacterium]|nr:ThuA domain-containing protein [Phycisphaerales bacterium]
MNTTRSWLHRSSRIVTPVLACLASAALLLAFSDSTEQDPPPPPRKPGAPASKIDQRPRVLVFSKTAGYRHGSIPTGIKTMIELGKEHGFDVVATEDASRFNEQDLDALSCVVFLNTTGDILDDAQQKHFEKFIRNGGGYVGVHSAADTEYDWPWYGRLVGAWFKTHPRIQPAKINVEDRTFPATRMLPPVWDRTDEWYVYRENPRPNVKVLMSLDETSYQGGGMNGDHPISWYHDFDGGRAFYTGGGHTNESYAEPLFRQHLSGAVMWACGRSDVPAKKKPTAPLTIDQP